MVQRAAVVAILPSGELESITRMEKRLVKALISKRVMMVVATVMMMMVMMMMTMFMSGRRIKEIRIWRIL